MIPPARCWNAPPRLALAGTMLVCLLHIAGCVAIQDEDDDISAMEPLPTASKLRPRRRIRP